MKPQKKWLKKRHGIVRNIVYVLMYWFVRLKYGIRPQKFKNKEKRPYLILYNHQTPFDQFFVGMSFPGAVYYMATEDIFSLGFLSLVLRFLVAPIPINKSTTDIRAVKICLQVAKEGGTIAIAPEGNRTFSGKTESMSPTIAALAKKLGLPIALYRIEGGYGVQPRFSDAVRRGKMRSYVSRVIEPEEYGEMSCEALYREIVEGLTVNEAVNDGTYRHKKRAEHIERLLYVCPTCGLTRFQSRGSLFWCTACRKKIEYLPTKELMGVDFTLPFRFVNDWYTYQEHYVRSLDVDTVSPTPLWEDTADISRVIIGKKKVPLMKNATLRLYQDRVTVGEDQLVFDFAAARAMAVMGKNKLNIYMGKDVYQIKGDKSFNAVKYVNFCYHYKNAKDGQPDGKFLGL